MIIRVIDMETGDEDLIEVPSQIPTSGDKIFQVYTDKREDLLRILNNRKQKNELQ